VIVDQLFDSSFMGLQKQMDLTLRRHEAITSNVANAETPQYRAVDINFSDELNKAFDSNKSEILTTHPKHLQLIEDSGAHLINDLSGATKSDGNNVDVDIQMGKLVFNSSKYTGAASLIKNKLQHIRQIVREAV
jgi:flagellar basal-body rod protein FlgB